MDTNKLVEELKKQNVKTASLQRKLDEAKEKEILPELRKRYEGKYFTYDNSDGTRHWKVYYKVLAVTDAMIMHNENFGAHVSAFVFQHWLPKELRGTKQFQLEYGVENVSDDMLQKEITKSEFDRAWKSALEKIHSAKV